ncbi:MAG TPA: acetate--CoA ligase family protein, partial [Mycobacteriales bacterium]|nr:acetate--CoA ligase family protein [Mycobacteriales bacterium]
NPGSLGHRVFRNILAAEFAGVVYPVNPSAAAVAGIRAYSSLRDLPEPVDLVVIAVPAEQVESVVADAGAMGATGLVVLSAGFADANGGEGEARQQRLLDLAREHGMRVVGPLSAGIANTDPAVSLNASVSPTPPPPGRVAILTQSGALGLALLERVRLLGLGVSTAVSAGNKVDVSGNDLLQYWETDPGTDVVVLYLQSFGNPRKFARVARRVSRIKPIVAVKSGRAGEAVDRRSATRDVAVDALFRQAGVIRVDTLRQLFDVVAVAAYQPLPAGPRLALIGNSMGTLAIAADAARAAGLQITRSDDLRSWASAADYAAGLESALADPTVDSVLVLFAPSAGASPAEVARVIVAAAGTGSGKPVVPTFLGCEFRRDELRPLAGRTPPFSFPESAAHALGRVVRYAEWRRRPEGHLPPLTDVDVARARACLPLTEEEYGTGELAENCAVEMLSCFGIEVRPRAVLEGVATTVGLEQDPSFGPILRFGLAGVTTDLLGDVAFRILPLTDVDAAELVRAPAAAPLLFDAPVDVPALENLLMRVGQLAQEIPEVAELLLEPVVVGRTGAVATGVRVRLEPHEHRPAPLLRRLAVPRPVPPPANQPAS